MSEKSDDSDELSSLLAFLSTPVAEALGCMGGVCCGVGGASGSGTSKSGWSNSHAISRSTALVWSTLDQVEERGERESGEEMSVV